MKPGFKIRGSWTCQAAIGTLALAFLALPASAQVTGGAGGSPTPGGGGGAGGSPTPGGGGGGMGTTTTVFGSGATGGTKGATGGTGTSPISKSDPFNTYYASPMASGLGASNPLKSTNMTQLSLETGGIGATLVTKPGAFGTPMYANITTKAGAAAGGGGGGGQSASGFNTIGIKRTPQYITTLDLELAPPPPTMVELGKLATDLQGLLADAPDLAKAQGISVVIDNQTVVLRGTVTNEKERKLAEALVRLEPSVFDVRNELQIGKGP